MSISAEKLKNILSDSFKIKANEKVLITGLVKWTYTVAIECESVGASPICLVSPSCQQEKVFCKKFRVVTDNQLLKLTEEIDAWIEICLPFPHRRTNQKKKEIKAGAVMPKWISRIIDKGIKQCSLIVPEGSLRVRNAVLKALEVDPEHMIVLGNTLKELFVPARNVHITTNLGTDLHLVLSGAGVDVDCGRWNPDLQVEKILYMPSGVVTTRPLENSANGIVIIPKAYLQRAHTGWIRDLQLRFENGKVKSFQSKTGLSVFKKILNETTGDKDIIGEFGIGLNSAVHEMIGSMRVDELMYGAARIAIGDNHWWMNGKNVSDLHWDFILPEATVELDGKTIMKRGQFHF